MQKHHAPADNSENHPRDFAAGQIAPHFPQTVAETSAVGHAQWPSKLDLLNVAADQLPVLHGKRQYPLPESSQ